MYSLPLVSREDPCAKFVLNQLRTGVVFLIKQKLIGNLRNSGIPGLATNILERFQDIWEFHINTTEPHHDCKTVVSCRWVWINIEN